MMQCAFAKHRSLNTIRYEGNASCVLSINLEQFYDSKEHFPAGSGDQSG